MNSHNYCPISLGNRLAAFRLRGTHQQRISYSYTPTAKSFEVPFSMKNIATHHKGIGVA